MIGNHLGSGFVYRVGKFACCSIITEMRAKKPIAIVDAYYDHEGNALCPMATGISHHVNPKGGIEPCPIIQFANESIDDERGIYRTLTESKFLKDFREATANETRGCIMLERPDLVENLIERNGAKDVTIRQTALQELQSMKVFESLIVVNMRN